MATTTHAGHATKHRPAPHHLSQRGATTLEVGWVESISSLTEAQAATQLLAGAAAVEAPPASEGAVAGSAPALSSEEQHAEQLERAISYYRERVSSVGEVLADLGAPGSYGPSGLAEAELEALVAAVTAAMGAASADLVVLRRRRVAAPSRGGADSCVADCCIRRRCGAGPPLEVRVSVIGNVDSGKSTLVGVLTRSMLDDGRGLARSKVFKHSHEESTGRTSSIGQHTLCLDSRGAVLNDGGYRPTAIADYVSRSCKVLTLIDLCGHERYFKTTMYGMTGHLPDWACLIVGSNAGVVGMCKEHLGMALALRVPVFFVVTKIDLAPAHVLKHSLQTLQAILKKPGVKKKPFLVRTEDDVLTCARHMDSDSLAPIFLTSSVTGEGLDLVRMFYNLLPRRFNWHERVGGPVEFIIDEAFGVPGVGTVVAGTCKSGVITPNTTFLLGPDIADGSFKPCQIKSIHYKRLPVGRVEAGQTAALALKKIKRSAVRKGMVLVDESVKPRASWEFEADIAILTHSTTISPRYQAVIHCEIVRQSARVVAMDRELLRSGDRALVRFRFLQRPEYLTIGSRFVFREGRTKGIGMVVSTEMSPREDQAAPTAPRS